jgi:hypothetical protein
MIHTPATRVVIVMDNGAGACRKGLVPVRRSPVLWAFATSMNYLRNTLSRQFSTVRITLARARLPQYRQLRTRHSPP